MWNTINSVISSFLGVFTSVYNFLLSNPFFLIIIGFAILSRAILLLFTICRNIGYNNRNIRYYSNKKLYYNTDDDSFGEEVPYIYVSQNELDNGIDWDSRPEIVDYNPFDD